MNSQNSHKAIVTTTCSSSNTTSDTDSQPSKQLVMGIAEMFMTWKKIFKSKMKSEDWGFDTVDLWAMVLTDLQITKSEFEAAKRKSYGLTWLPTAPADFLALGRIDPILNYPDVYDAYIDAAHHKWDSEGILYYTAKLVGLGAMREQSEAKTYPLWQKHYPSVCKLHSQGLIARPMQSPQIANEAQPVACDEQTASHYLNKIRAILAENKK